MPTRHLVSILDRILPGLIRDYCSCLLFQRDRRGSEGGALAPEQAPLGVVRLDHHRELEPVPLDGKGAGLVLPGELRALDAQGLLELADPAPYLEPPSRRQAQIGVLIWPLEGIDPGAPQPVLQDLVFQLLFALKLHPALFCLSNHPLRPGNSTALRAYGKVTMCPMRIDPAPWRKLSEALAGHLTARARGLLASEFALMDSEGAQIGRLEMHGPE